MVDVLKVPRDDRFQVISEHASERLIIDPHYLRIERSSDAIIIQITLSEGRALEQKRAFYAALASELQAQIALRPADLMISLVEVNKENWSFGNGEAQYT